MQIIIPMTGNGSRFVAAGYKDLKPLIEVQGRRMVDWIVKGMYRASDSFTFICRAEHLNSITWLENYLKSLAPNVKIFAVNNWTKLGPVADVIRAQKTIDDQNPVIINYCDFYMEWNCEAFIMKQQNVTAMELYLATRDFIQIFCLKRIFMQAVLLIMMKI